MEGTKTQRVTQLFDKLRVDKNTIINHLLLLEIYDSSQKEYNKRQPLIFDSIPDVALAH